MKEKTKWYVSGFAAAFIIGILAGYFRYWYGFFVLGQGIISGLVIAYVMKKSVKNEILSSKNFNPMRTSLLTLLLLIVFYFAQFIGFGLSQPWFEPFSWFYSAVSGNTSEEVFGLSLMGGVIGRGFNMGLNGGFWLFLNIFDMLFMGFFITVGINSQLEKEK